MNQTQTRTNGHVSTPSTQRAILTGLQPQQEANPHAASKLQVRGLNMYYGTQQVLHDISLDIYEHQITALMGPSGSGKTTFLRTLNRLNDVILEARTTGRVLIDGTNVLDPALDVAQLRKRVGMVFQRPNPFPMSIWDNVAFALKVHKLSKGQIAERVEQSLKDAALWDEVRDKLKGSAYGLSGGQQQRLCIARAIALRPDVLLMDEPTSALDPIATLKIEELLFTLKQEYTIVIVTHSLQQAARVSEHCVLFLAGRLAETGPTRQVFMDPQSKETEDFVTGRFG